MSKKKKLGRDPLAWIGDSRKKPKSGKLSPVLRKVKAKIQDEELKAKEGKARAKLEARLQRDEEELKRPSVERGLPPGWTRVTFILRKETLEKLRAVAHWERKEIKQVVDEVLETYLRSENVKPKPEGK